MSSVNGSDSSSSSSSSNEVRRNREEYNKNEADMVKRHQREIRRLNEHYAQEVDALKSAHEKQLEDMQRQAHDTITERDQRNQSEIDNIRQMHRKQLQSNAEDTQNREETLKNTIKSEKAAQKRVEDDREANYKSVSKENSDEQKDLFAKRLNENRQEVVQGLSSQREKLQKAQKEEIENLRGQKDEKIGQLEHDYTDYRRFAQRRERDEDLKHMEETQRQSDSHMHAIKHEQQLRADAEKSWHDDDADGLNSIQQHYRENLQKNVASNDQARENFQGEVYGRIDNEVRRLKNDNENLKEGQAAYRRQLDRHKEQEIRNVKDEFGKNIENYKEQRDDAVRLGNERRDRDVANINEKDARFMQESNRAYQERLYEQDRRSAGQYKTATSDFEARNQQLEGQTNKRVKNILSDTEQQMQRMARLHQDQHDTLQNQQSDKLKTIRMDADAERRDAVDRVKEQARQKVLAGDERIAQTSSNYEKRINTIQDQLLRERKAANDRVQRMTDELTREHKLELDQQAAKYENRLKALQAQQSEEIRRTNQANEEKMQQLAISQRKA